MKSEADRAEAKCIRELRKEISKLKSEVRQLRKRLKQYEQVDGDKAYRDELDAEIGYLEKLAEEAGKKEEEQKKCPHCGSKDVSFFSILGRPYFKCQYEPCGKKGFLDKIK